MPTRGDRSATIWIARSPGTQDAMRTTLTRLCVGSTSTLRVAPSSLLPASSGRGQRDLGPMTLKPAATRDEESGSRDQPGLSEVPRRVRRRCAVRWIP